jgi:MFS family permease
MSRQAAAGGDRLEPRVRRSVVALLTSAFCSSTAMAALTITLGKQVYDLTGRELDLGLLGLAEFAPALLRVFVTGPVADRFDRRTIARCALLAEAACAAGLAWYSGTDPTSVGPIFLLVIAYGIARAFAMPATRSLPADTVVPRRLPWLVARQSVTWQAATIVGPVAAGFLYVAGLQLPFVMVVVLLILSALSITFVRTDARDAEMRRRAAVPDDPGAAGTPEATTATTVKARRVTMHDAFEGIRFVRGQPILLGVISLDLFAVLFGGAVALLPAIAEDRLGVGAVGLDWLRAAVGIGAACVTLVLTVRPVSRRIGVRLLLSVGLFFFTRS